MRARNREINIFNMSLLDILTGMLGAFLFLMLGLLPFYAKVARNKIITPEEAKKFEELKKLLDAGLQGPLTPEQAQALRDQMAALEARISSLESEVNQTRQDLQAMTEDRDKWRDAQRCDLLVAGEWESSNADVDIFIVFPGGKVGGPKKEKLLGQEVAVVGIDSHKPGRPAQNSEELLSSINSGEEYLIMYRVHPGAVLADYSNLSGWVMVDDSIGNAYSALPLYSPNASRATPGNLYAWAVISYEKGSLIQHTPTGKLPAGVLMP